MLVIYLNNKAKQINGTYEIFQIKESPCTKFLKYKISFIKIEPQNYTSQLGSHIKK